jgi:hypothetical protein
MGLHFFKIHFIIILSSYAYYLLNFATKNLFIFSYPGLTAWTIIVENDSPFV